MDNRKAIVDFAKGLGHEIKGFLNLLPESSDMENGKFFWYRDNAGVTYMILPKYQDIVIVTDDKAIHSIPQC